MQGQSNNLIYRHSWKKEGWQPSKTWLFSIKWYPSKMFMVHGSQIRVEIVRGEMRRLLTVFLQLGCVNACSVCSVHSWEILHLVINMLGLLALPRCWASLSVLLVFVITASRTAFRQPCFFWDLTSDQSLTLIVSVQAGMSTGTCTSPPPLRPFIIIIGVE